MGLDPSGNPPRSYPEVFDTRLNSFHTRVVREAFELATLDAPLA